MMSGTDPGDLKLSPHDDPDLVPRLVSAAGRREQPPPEARERAWETAATLLRDRTRVRRRRQVAAAMAASVAALMIAALVWRLPPGPGPLQIARVDRIIGTVELQPAPDQAWRILGDDTGALPRDSRLRTREGSRAGLGLAPGISLRLAADTEIVLESPRRIRLVAGMIYLDSGSAGRSAVEVVTEAGIATDLGTQFEVRYLDSTLRLRVREGSVALQRGRDQLSAGQGDQLTVDQQGRWSRIRLAANDPDWQWVEGVAPAPDIEGQPLEVLLRWVRRETGHPLRYAQPEAERQAATVILHGSIRDLPPMEALSVMLATTDLAYAMLADGTILISRQDPSVLSP